MASTLYLVIRHATHGASCIWSTLSIWIRIDGDAFVFPLQSTCTLMHLAFPTS
jgi:hypothetical protein